MTIYEYCRENTPNFEKRESAVMDIISETHEPLRSASPELYHDLTEQIERYCEENGLNAEDFDTEDVFWDM